MSIKKRNPILVTGSHRSGSTWAGVMLAGPPDVAYVNEPFNILYKPGSCRPHFDYWYTYVCHENEAYHYQYVKDCISFKPHAIKKTFAHGSLTDLPRLMKFQIQCLKARMLYKRPLMKDPLALFSTEWLAERFNMDVVLLIRHPAAFVGSLKVADWPFPFSHLLKQPLLLEHYLTDFKDEIKEYADHEHDIIDQAILLWNLIYSTAAKFQLKHGEDWIFVKHEDLSRAPLDEFRRIYHKLDLSFTEAARNRIAKYSFADEQDEERMKRDSKSNIWKWTYRLTDEEIRRVREKTENIASKFYGEEDWLR